MHSDCVGAVPPMKRTARFVGLLVAFAIVIPASASALPTVLGGQLFYAGGDVTVQVYQNDAGFTNLLELCSAVPEQAVAYNYEVGKTVTFTAAQLASWGLQSGEELIFCINVLNTGYKWFMGPASRNVDGALHANVVSVGGGVYDVGFEDLYGGGDQDYNDTVFRFSSGVTSTASEPSVALMLLPGLAAIGFARVRRRAA